MKLWEIPIETMDRVVACYVVPSWADHYDFETPVYASLLSMAFAGPLETAKHAATSPDDILLWFETVPESRLRKIRITKVRDGDHVPKMATYLGTVRKDDPIHLYALGV